MAFDLADLLGCLELVEVEPQVYEGRNLDLGYHRVFGGQILAQVVAAAARTSPGKAVKSLHVLFPREGDATTPLRYRVEPLQEGRTFGAMQVVASQADRVVAAAAVSMHADEPGLHRSEPPPAVGDPADASARDLAMVPWETRIVDGIDLASRGSGPPRLEWWMRAPALRGEPHVHFALLAHATDLTLIGTALRPFDGISQADSTGALHTAVTSHTVWFHQPFRLDDWLLLVQHSPVVSNGRAYGRGDVFVADELVASFAQEAMIRQAGSVG